MKFTFAICKICNRDVFNEKELVAFKRLRPLHLERVNLEGQQPWRGMLCVCLQCATAITQAIEKVNKEVFSAPEIPPGVEEMFEAMNKHFYESCEKYRVKSLETLIRKMMFIGHHKWGRAGDGFGSC